MPVTLDWPAVQRTGATSPPFNRMLASQVPLTPPQPHLPASSRGHRCPRLARQRHAAVDGRPPRLGWGS